MRRSALALLAVLLCHATVVPAQQTAIPPDLKPWESWVLYGEEFRRCPLRDGEDAEATQCVRLHLARPHARCSVIGRRRVPAELAHLRRELGCAAGRRRALAGSLACRRYSRAGVEREGVPQLRLSAGDHTISGSFTGRAGPSRCSSRR